MSSAQVIVNIKWYRPVLRRLVNAHEMLPRCPFQASPCSCLHRELVLGMCLRCTWNPQRGILRGGYGLSRGSCRLRRGTGGCGRELAPGPGVAADELALTLEVKFALQFERSPLDITVNVEGSQGFLSETLIGKFGSKTPPSPISEIAVDSRLKIGSSV